MRLKEIRARKLLTIRELAERSHVSPSTIQNTEQGIYLPSLSVVRKLAEALGVDPADVDELRARIEATVRGRVRPNKAAGNEPIGDVDDKGQGPANGRG